MTDQKEQIEPDVTMVNVVSAQIKKIGYDVPSQSLYVQFTKGVGRYKYPGVPASMFVEIREAESPGGYFNVNIKPKFPHVYVPPVEEKEKA